MQTNKVLEVLSAKRQALVAEFMDENPETFPLPTQGLGWVDRRHAGEPLAEKDLRLMERALGMLMAVFRTAQLTMSETQPLSEMLSPETLPDVLEVELDPVAFALMGGDHEDEEAVAFARSVTLLKQMTGIGVVHPEQILSLIEETMDALPGHSKLQRSAHEIAKRMALTNVELMMAN